ncbi:NAD(P)-dependent oxidoreductase [Bacillus sp. AK031]
MKIALLGATGRVGSIILENLLEEGHAVNALVRSDVKKDHAGLSVFKGNVLNEINLQSCFSGCNAVISALGTDKNDVLSKSMPLILKAMRHNHIKRIITIGTAGILQARETQSLFRFQTNESKRKSTTAAEDHLRTYLMLKESGMNWTIVCPTYLPEGERKGNYRTDQNMLPEGGKKISIYDTADFASSLVEDTRSFNMRVGISY